MSLINLEFDAPEKKTEPNVTAPHAEEAVDFSVLRSFDDEPSAEPDLIVELIDLYLEEASKSLERIKQGLQNGDGTMVKRLAHSLRGSSSNLGIMGMAKLSQRLELTELDENSAAELLGCLREEFTRVRQILTIERAGRMK